MSTEWRTDQGQPCRNRCADNGTRASTGSPHGINDSPTFLSGLTWLQLYSYDEVTIKGDSLYNHSIRSWLLSTSLIQFAGALSLWGGTARADDTDDIVMTQMREHRTRGVSVDLMSKATTGDATMWRTLGLSWILALICALPVNVKAAEPVTLKPAGAYDPKLYLPRLANAERAVEQGQADVEDAPTGRNPALEVLSAILSMVGDVDGAIATFDRRTPAAPVPLPPQQVSQMSQIVDARADDAIRTIVDQARTKRVVLINEAHHVPMHRAFTQKLAAELRKIGYSYLAAEAFRANHEGSVILSAGNKTSVLTGVYTSDPVFAEFVNAALADGWKLVPYDMQGRPTPGTDPAERMKQREQAQAQNLVNRIFAKDPNAKVLIHVGYGHLQKLRPGDTHSPVYMGEYLHRMTGLEMLHVDQTSFYAHPDRAAEGPVYAGLVEKFPSKKPFVLRSPDGSFPVLGMQGMVDIQVVFPRYATRDGRPEWLQTLADRTPREIPTELLPKQGRRLIKAFRPADGPDTVPADIVLVEGGTPAPRFMLPPGQFRYTYEE